MEKKPRLEHCSFKVLNNHGKCVAACHWLQESRNEFDCIGNFNPANEPEQADIARGKEFKI